MFDAGFVLIGWLNYMHKFLIICCCCVAIDDEDDLAASARGNIKIISFNSAGIALSGDVLNVHETSDILLVHISNL